MSRVAEFIFRRRGRNSRVQAPDLVLRADGIRRDLFLQHVDLRRQRREHRAVESSAGLEALPGSDDEERLACRHPVAVPHHHGGDDAAAHGRYAHGAARQGEGAAGGFLAGIFGGAEEEDERGEAGQDEAAKKMPGDGATGSDTDECSPVAAVTAWTRPPSRVNSASFPLPRIARVPALTRRLASEVRLLTTRVPALSRTTVIPACSITTSSRIPGTAPPLQLLASVHLPPSGPTQRTVSPKNSAEPEPVPGSVSPGPPEGSQRSSSASSCNLAVRLLGLRELAAQPVELG